MSWLEEMKLNSLGREELSLYDILEIENSDLMNVYKQAIKSGGCSEVSISGSEYIKTIIKIDSRYAESVEAAKEVCKSTLLFPKIYFEDKSGVLRLDLTDSKVYCVFGDYMSARIFFDNFPNKENPIGIENVSLERFNISYFENKLYEKDGDKVVLGIIKGNKLYEVSQLSIRLAYAYSHKQGCIDQNILITTPPNWGECRFTDFEACSYSNTPEDLREYIEEIISKDIEHELFDKKKINLASVVIIKHITTKKLAILISIDTTDDNAIDVILDDVYKILHSRLDGGNIGYAAIDSLSACGKFVKYCSKVLLGAITR